MDEKQCKPYIRPCPVLGHTHALTLYRVITGPVQHVDAVTEPVIEDGALFFWAERAADIWAILNHETVFAGQHAVYAADLTEIRHPDRWRLA